MADMTISGEYFRGIENKLSSIYCPPFLAFLMRL